MSAHPVQTPPSSRLAAVHTPPYGPCEAEAQSTARNEEGRAPYPARRQELAAFLRLTPFLPQPHTHNHSQCEVGSLVPQETPGAYLLGHRREIQERETWQAIHYIQPGPQQPSATPATALHHLVFNDEPIAPHCRCILLRSAQHRRRGGVAHEAQVRLQHTHTHSVAHRGGRCTLEEGAPQQARASLVPATGSNARRHLGSQPGPQPVHGRMLRCQQRSARPYTRTVAYKVVVEPQSLHGRQHREVCQRLQRRSACELVGATLHHRFSTGHTSNLFLSTTSVSRQVNLSKFAPVLRGATM